MMASKVLATLEAAELVLRTTLASLPRERKRVLQHAVGTRHDGFADALKARLRAW